MAPFVHGPRRANLRCRPRHPSRLLWDDTEFRRPFGRLWSSTRIHRGGDDDATRTEQSTDNTNNNENDTTVVVYEELVRLASDLRRHDALYYESEMAVLTDDEFDALVRREAELCRTYPSLLQRLERESGLGVQATRYGGRVGNVLLPTTTTTTPNNATRIVVDRVKRPHVRPMLSLDNVHREEELLAWLERIRKKLTVDDGPSSLTILTEPKLDGLSLSCRYEQRQSNTTLYTFVWASTRGDGKQGQDVTHAVQQGNLVPLTLDWASLLTDPESYTHPKVLEIRGEIVLPTTVFQSLEGEGLAFANARNAASGILLRKESTTDPVASQALREKLCFYAYDVAGDDGFNVSGVQLRRVLPTLGFRVPEPVAVTRLRLDNTTAWNVNDIQALLKYHHSMQHYRQGKKTSQTYGDYDMDGAVHKVSESDLRIILGQSNRAPRWAIAHKFAPLAAVTTLLDITVQVGRTGALTPVAILQPVEMAGVVVRRATLHNFAHMQQVLESTTTIAKESSVLVRRAGDVIPQVVQRIAGTDAGSNNGFDTISVAFPETCPACGSPVVTDEVNKTASKETAGQVLRCGGPQWNCPPRAVGSIAHAVSRDALDVTGLSEARIMQLIEAGFISRPSDIFALAKSPTQLDKLAEMDGWGPKSAQNLAAVANRIAKNGISLSRFVYSLGIRFSGVHSSALIAAAYGSVDDFLKDVEAASTLPIKQVQDQESNDEQVQSFARLREETDITKGIGPVLLNSLDTFAQDQELVEAAESLSSSILVLADDSAIRVPTLATTGPLQDMAVVFTGSISEMSRSEAKKWAKVMGAKSTPGSISKLTGLVVAGEKGGKKLEQAEKLGVRVIDTEEFLQMVNMFRR